MMTLPLPFLSSMVTLRPRRRRRVSWASRTLGSTASAGLGGLGLGFGVEEALDVVFGGADGEVEGENLLRGGDDGLGRVEREQGAGVAEAELAGLDVVLD